MPLPRNIILTGFMGSGKTVVGRRLATQLGWQFVDLDRLVERRARLSVKNIFLRRGEPVFRRLEHQAIRSLSRRRRCVIAAGGGALIHRPNGSLLRDAGLRVWLRVPVAELVRRLRGGKRPLLASAEGAPREMRRLITRLLRTRTRAYAAADMTFNAGRGSPSMVATALRRRICR